MDGQHIETPRTPGGDGGNATTLVLETFQNARILRKSLTTKSVSPSEQFSFWREVAEGVGIVDRPGSYSAPFVASSVNHVTSSVYYSRYHCAEPSSIDRSKKYAESYGSDTLAFQLRVSGMELDNNLGTGRYFKPGDIRIFDLSQPLSSKNTAFENIALVVQKRDLLGRLSDPEALHGKILPESVMTNMLQSYMKSALQTVPELSVAQSQRVNEATFEMLGAAIMGTIRPDVLESEDTDGASLQAVRMYIERNLKNPDLTPEMIAKSTAMSRTKLYRVCKPYGTPMELVRYRRLRRAMDYLRADNSMSVELVSYAVGYKNRESFSRAFKAEFGMSASEFRRTR